MAALFNILFIALWLLGMALVYTVSGAIYTPN